MSGTFVKSDKSLISIDPTRISAKIDDKIYSGFIEHMGRCIYGGIVDYSEEANLAGLTNEKGYRLDVAEKLRALNMPVIRYPGGNFVSTYHWLDGVGPKESRPRRPDLAWRGEESNQFGTDEFLDWCQFMGVEPYICLNMGTGTLDEALAWLEYCNSDGDTYYANLRRKNGHKEPYNVKYWALGNEMWGDWQVGQLSAEDYAKKAHQWGKALKMIDANIQVVGCGNSGVNNWDLTVTQKLINQMDYYSIHLYTTDPEYYRNITSTIAAEESIEVAARLLEIARINARDKSTRKRDVKICFDEWNVWDPVRADGQKGAEETYTLTDSLGVASWCNVFVRQAKNVGMANIAQCVNVISPIKTSKKGLLLQTTYHSLLLFSQFMRGSTLNVHVSSPVYTGSNIGSSVWGLEWVSDVVSEIPLLDVSATINGKFVSIAVVNRSKDEDIGSKLDLQGTLSELAQVYTIYHDNIEAINSWENSQNVVPTLKEISANEIFGDSRTFKFKKHSFTLIRVSLAS
ncbi:hypothetical protein AWJ20_1302 [Sugiyamaella lignohabitans]|uniref:non-reducing end alpha-L-arabinofuranosidase n=1 Tax=Sugiyamaella lignohabitans TaxID=796027 RepID=A0A167DKU5_9ASCO|nr:uncharacterized protein AWJ20_1302 [Sugiyamaella lignohabitans]ANB13024.1 hypothetical protein AWJ20_1302 [Sugiyamaella lignohabitans]